MSEAFGPLVDAGWLSRHLDDPDLRIYDCSVEIVRAEDGSDVTFDTPRRPRSSLAITSNKPPRTSVAS